MTIWYLTHYRSPLVRCYEPTGFVGGRRLPLDVRADDEAYVITAAVPGLKPEGLKIEVLEDVVTLRGQIPGADEENDGYLMRELATGEFERSLRLPDPLDASKAEASIEDGLLTLRIPKAEEARPKTVKLKAH
ncbi:MAG: Hsp20/alpha crystallin family protein [Chloroflexota bacterium]